MQDYEIAARDLAALVAELKLSADCVFVPFSASRNAAENWQSLNWRCTIKRDGRPITGLEAVDYGQGVAYCPAHKAGANRFPCKSDLARAIALECETGKRAKPDFGGKPYASSDRIAPPTAAALIESLARDSDVLEYARFEDWAADLGFDPDSRKGEATYRVCLAQSLALRAAVGNDNLEKLRDLAQKV